MPSSDTYSAPVDFRITQTPDNDLDPAVLRGVAPLYAAVQQIIQTFMNNCGIGQQPQAFWTQYATQAPDATVLASNMGRVYATATEVIAFGAAISLWDSGGVLSVRNANATNNTKSCDGFCSTVAGIGIGIVGECILARGIVPVTGLTRGAKYWLSTVDGLITAVAPVAAGNIEQYLGKALSTTKLHFNAHYWVQH